MKVAAQAAKVTSVDMVNKGQKMVLPPSMQVQMRVTEGQMSAGGSVAINRMERMLGRDLDGDGDIGVVGRPGVPPRRRQY